MDAEQGNPFPLAGQVEELDSGLTLESIRSEVIDTAQRVLEADRDTVESSLRTRTLVDDALKKQARETAKDSWDVENGQYSLLDSDTQKDFKNRRLDRPFEGVELLMDRQIDELVARRRADGTILQRPVTVMDFGGGRGISMVRLAAKWREHVLAGEVLFVVTNLSYLPEPDTDKDGYSAVARAFNSDRSDLDSVTRSQEELEFVQTHQELVDYVEADAGELIGKTVPSAKGKPVNLIGGVDILHERHVVEHPHTPDVTLAVLTQCLSPEGTLFLSSRSTNPDDLLKPIATAEGSIDVTTAEYEAARRDAFTVGLEIIRMSSSQQIDTTPDRRLYYQVFTKPHAPDYATLRAQLDRPPAQT